MAFVFDYHLLFAHFIVLKCYRVTVFFSILYIYHIREYAEHVNFKNKLKIIIYWLE